MVLLTSRSPCNHVALSQAFHACDDPRRFWAGTPVELQSTIESVWQVSPSSQRIVDDNLPSHACWRLSSPTMARKLTTLQPALESEVPTPLSKISNAKTRLSFLSVIQTCALRSRCSPLPAVPSTRLSCFITQIMHAEPGSCNELVPVVAADFTSTCKWTSSSSYNSVSDVSTPAADMM